ncbi:discoidin domain-containing protein [Phenylobacterium soli]|uniref:discoidin domain-containing protein n=1 Tax=Phenylobacterium soli TaxID=2170551 RepID=UPI001403D582|nr:discoidin domain-containing protein [Phenylobacterium soli]
MRWLPLGLALVAGASNAAPLNLRVDRSPAGLKAAFRPDTALGGGVDGSTRGEIDRLFTPHNIAAMRSLGLRSLTYRLRTELGIEAWHWTEEGRWSDPAHAQGYWTSSDRPKQPVTLSWGYRLPRRGDTQDNANNLDFSRLTDGDLATFWKSNPYLDVRYTHEAAGRPQWIQVRLDAPTPIDTVRIDWADPYASAYEVQYWDGPDDYDSERDWVTFPMGRVAQARGGAETRRIAQRPVTARFLRILLKTPSGTAPPGSADVRDRLGYAVREVSFGVTGADGVFHDAVRHAASHDDQTFTHVSSTDPWHRAADRDPNLEQVGVDRIFQSGLGNGLPIMMPVGVLFDTPENAEALIRYLTRRGYPLRRIELGEEPDGQYGEPADYGALYLATLDRLRAIAPRLEYGGPSMQSAATDLPLVHGPARSWNRGFIAYLKSRGRLSDLQFFSFEHYPFDDICGDIHAKLIAEDALLDGMLKRLEAEGVPRTTPKVIAEYGFSAFSGQAMVELPSALLQADLLGHFLSEGGDAAYMFGYGPNTPINQHLACAGYGNMTPFLADANGQAAERLPQFFASRLISQTWLQPGHGLHRLYATHLDGEAPAGAVVAYAVARPDGRLATMVLNRSATQAFTVKPWAAGRLDVWQYGPDQYRWRPDGVNGRPSLDLPPAHWEAAGGEIRLPADSLTVILSRAARTPARSGRAPRSR